MRKLLFMSIASAAAVLAFSGCGKENESVPEEISVPESPQIMSSSGQSTANIPVQSGESSLSASTSNLTSSTTSSAASSTTSSSASSATSSTDSPESHEWTTTEFNAEMYVNTNEVYSRVKAVVGSDSVKLYNQNDKVKVVAKTDTEYYQLEDGTFIHMDYLSEKPVDTGTPPEEQNPADYTSTTATGYALERRNGITYVNGIMVANKTYTLPASYDPGITAEASQAYEEMRAAAENDGITLYIVSGYRSYADQDRIYNRYVQQDGAALADTYSSRPGHSDHQTGYTFDLNSLDESFADTPEGKWLAHNCADYGFIIRYPEGKEQYTGYTYEPWHVRYIGVDNARSVTSSGLSFEEYYGITSDYDDCTD